MNPNAMIYRFITSIRRTASPATLLAAAMLLPLAACDNAADQAAMAPPLEGARIGGPFTLVDKNGKTVTWDDFKGKWRIVYLGYTFCPDACPLDVQSMMKGFNIFDKAHPEAGAKIQPIFITIDPERDTPEVVGQWTAAFGPRLMGLTGTPAQVKVAADAFVANYSRGEDTAGGYLMDHSRATFLMDPDGNPIALLPVDQGPDAVAAEIAKWVK